MPFSSTASAVSSVSTVSATSTLGRGHCTIPPELRGAPRPASCPPRLAEGILQNLHNASPPSSPVNPVLDAAWSQVIAQWLTHAATAMRDTPGLERIDVPTLYRWRAFVAAAWRVLPSDLQLLLESRQLRDLFGLGTPLPLSFRSAVADVLRAEIARVVPADDASRHWAGELLNYIEACLQQPAQLALSSPVLKPLFEVLHEITFTRPALEHVHNIAR
ncbi:hypothetical protein [Stenotrophomonas sp. PS02289]|uniref:hypothetical protein n=1 Tax=Stenotrophomonas sp. PS02289 TaxID=2991422 RepID=UPI00249A0E84|nr:hypothetical protein [Stenotrophomonas sp. PS02289]